MAEEPAAARDTDAVVIGCGRVEEVARLML